MRREKVGAGETAQVLVLAAHGDFAPAKGKAWIG
jgi:hypothetical protein